MEHFAIDLGSRESQVCVRDQTGQIVLERRVQTHLLAKLLRQRAELLVVMETCAEAFGVADAALELGHQVRVVPATLVRALGVGARGIKTDVRDARVLSEASVRMDLPSVHVPTISAREGKAMCNARDVLIRARTMLINATRGYLRTQAVRVPGGASNSFAARVAKTLQGAATRPTGMSETKGAPGSNAGAKKPGATKVRARSRANATASKHQASTQTTTKEQSKFPSALSASGSLPVFADRVVCAVGQLTDWIEQADQELATRVAPDPVCQRLMSIPGVGPVCATRFVTTLDTVGRFASVPQMQSYLGLVPGEKQSGDKQQRTHAIKCGATQARAALVQSAWCMYRLRKEDPMVLWAQRIEKRRGKQIAITALARKLASVMFVMWRDGTTYDPYRSQQVSSEQKEATSTN